MHRGATNPAVDAYALDGSLTIGVSKASLYPHPLSPSKQIRDDTVRRTVQLENTRAWVRGISDGSRAPPPPLPVVDDTFVTLPRKARGARAPGDSISTLSTDAAAGALEYRPSMFHVDSADVYGEQATGRFVKEYKRRTKMGPSAVKVQRWFRGRRVMLKFMRWAKRRRDSRRKHFDAWKFVWRARKFTQFQIKLRFFKLLQAEAIETRETKHACVQLFRKTMSSNGRSPIVFHMFMSERVSAVAALTPEQRRERRRKILGRDPVPRGAGSEEMDPDDFIEGMKQMMNVRIKKMFLLEWYHAIKRQQRSYARANQSLQRVARNVWGSARDMWITERLAVILEMWHRYALFRRCKRYGQGIPVFPTALTNWTTFVDNYQARKLRQRMSTHYMPKNTMRRCFRRWLSAIFEQKRMRDKRGIALSWHSRRLLNLCFDAIRGMLMYRTVRHKFLVKYLKAWHDVAATYALLKRKAKYTRDRMDVLAVRGTWQKWRTEKVIQGMIVTAGVGRMQSSQHYSLALWSMATWLGKSELAMFVACWRSWIRGLRCRQRWRQFLFVYLRAQARHMLAVCFQAWRGKETPSHVTVSPPIMTTAECVQVLKDIDGGKRLEDEWDERVLRRLLLDPPPSDFVVAKALRDGATQPVKRAPKTSSSSRPPMLHEKRRASLTMALSFRSSLFVQRQTVGGDTPLHIAADEGNLDEVRRLLKEGWDPNAQNLRQQTPLHLAARHYASEFLPVVGVLVECGASVSMKDKEGYTASQLATSEAIMFVLGQHITRLNNLQFTSYERSMYRKRATLKWLPNVSFSRLMPAFAGWLLATKHNEAVDTFVLSKEGARVKAAAGRALHLTLSPNRYQHQPRGGLPGSPQRLRAAGAVVQSDDPHAVARRAEKRRLALEYLMEHDATVPKAYESLVSRQKAFGHRRNQLLEFVFERNRFLLANSKMRESLEVFTAQKLDFSSTGGYRDATKRAVEVVATRQLSNMGYNAAEIMAAVEVTMSGPAIDPHARAGVSLVYEDVTTPNASALPTSPKKNLLTSSSSQQLLSATARLERQNTSDGMALVAKQRVKVPMLGKGTGKGGGQSAYALALTTKMLKKRPDSSSGSKRRRSISGPSTLLLEPVHSSVPAHSNDSLLAVPIQSTSTQSLSVQTKTGGKMNSSAVFLMGTPTALAMRKPQALTGVASHILGSPHVAEAMSNRSNLRQVSPLRYPVSSPSKGAGFGDSPVRRHSMDDSTHLLLSNIRQRMEQASQFGLPLTDEELGFAPATGSDDVDSLADSAIDEKYLRPIVMPGLPMDYGLMAGLMVRSFKDAVRFQNGIYPENQVASAPVGDYLKALWDPRSEALILKLTQLDSRFDSTHYNSDAVSVDKLLIALASHYVVLEDSTHAIVDKDKAWKECMKEWSEAHATFAEEEYAAWECLRKAELSVTQGYQIAGLASDCVSLVTAELEELERCQEAASARIDAAKSTIDSINDDIEIMKKTRDAKAAKLNVMRNACKKASKDIVGELKALEKQVVRPRAETAAKLAKYEEAKLKVDEAVEQVREFRVILGPDNPTTIQAEETIQRISKSVIVAEKEYRTAKSVSDPIETALADAKRRLEESMGANKLGSILELEDLDAITSKETEMLPKLREATNRLDDAKAVLQRIQRHETAANEGLEYWKKRSIEADAILRDRLKTLEDMQATEVVARAQRFEAWKQAVMEAKAREKEMLALTDEVVKQQEVLEHLELKEGVVPFRGFADPIPFEEQPGNDGRSLPRDDARTSSIQLRPNSGTIPRESPPGHASTVYAQVMTQSLPAEGGDLHESVPQKSRESWLRGLPSTDNSDEKLADPNLSARSVASRHSVASRPASVASTTGAASTVRRKSLAEIESSFLGTMLASQAATDRPSFSANTDAPKDSTAPPFIATGLTKPPRRASRHEIFAGLAGLSPRSRRKTLEELYAHSTGLVFEAIRKELDGLGPEAVEDLASPPPVLGTLSKTSQRVSSSADGTSETDGSVNQSKSTRLRLADVIVYDQLGEVQELVRESDRRDGSVAPDEAVAQTSVNEPELDASLLDSRLVSDVPPVEGSSLLDSPSGLNTAVPYAVVEDLVGNAEPVMNGSASVFTDELLSVTAPTVEVLPASETNVVSPEVTPAVSPAVAPSREESKLEGDEEYEGNVERGVMNPPTEIDNQVQKPALPSQVSVSAPAPSSDVSNKPKQHELLHPHAVQIGDVVQIGNDERAHGAPRHPKESASRRKSGPLKPLLSDVTGGGDTPDLNAILLVSGQQSTTNAPRASSEQRRRQTPPVIPLPPSSSGVHSRGSPDLAGLVVAGKGSAEAGALPKLGVRTTRPESQPSSPSANLPSPAHETWNTFSRTPVSIPVAAAYTELYSSSFPVDTNSSIADSVFSEDQVMLPPIVAPGTPSQRLAQSPPPAHQDVVLPAIVRETGEAEATVPKLVSSHSVPALHLPSGGWRKLATATAVSASFKIPISAAKRAPVKRVATLSAFDL